MPDDLSPAEHVLGQCIWSVIAAAMDDDVAAVEYLLGGLTETELGAVIVGMAGIFGHSLIASYGRDEARAMAAGHAVRHVAAAGE